MELEWQRLLRWIAHEVDQGTSVTPQSHLSRSRAAIWWSTASLHRSHVQTPDSTRALHACSGSDISVCYDGRCTLQSLPYNVRACGWSSPRSVAPIAVVGNGYYDLR